MLKKSNAFEWFIQGTIIVSLIVHLIDLHIVREKDHGLLVNILHYLDLCIITIFTAEYLLRWYWSTDRWRYPFTTMAIIDLLVILPFYFSQLLDVRSLRLIRMIRVLQLLKVYRYNRAMRSFFSTIRKVLPQLEIIGFILMIVVIISSTAMFNAERDAQPDKFENMADSLWWCVVSLSTVGYGDLTPVTSTGRVIASLTMLIGLGLFGTFISLIGGAFITAMQDEEQQSLTVSKTAYILLRDWQRDNEEPYDIESLREHADKAIEEYVTRQKHLAFQNE
ncbi:MAG TPA: ion transporter [Gemmatales bacterium]|nr:ion transporter [Gemmatales bacterium]